ncbi:MAG: flagellar biosynthesis anti-sigma factor FlgM [Phycisphaerales bacterium]
MNRLHRTYTVEPIQTALALDEEEPEIRVEKILDIRRQLGEGRYSIEDRLDVVIDKILAELA